MAIEYKPRVVRLRHLLVLLLVAFFTGCASFKSDPAALVDLHARALQAYGERDCDQAIELYSELAEGLPKNAEVWLKIGNCLARTNRREEAVDAYRQAIKRDPEYIKAWYNLSYLQAQMLGKTVAAMAVHIDPSDSSLQPVRKLAQEVLSAFDLSVKAQRSRPLKIESSRTKSSMAVEGIRADDEN